MRLRYADLYGGLDWYSTKTSEESEAWSHLSLLDQHDVLTEADWSSLHQWTARAEALADKVDANIVPVKRDGVLRRPYFSPAAGLGVVVKPFRFLPGSQAARDALCRPLL